MAYESKAIANYFLDLVGEAGETLTPMKLQKLVYFAHGWNLGLNGEPLINEQVEAWTWGPVIRSLYHQFKRFGDTPITCRATHTDSTLTEDMVEEFFTYEPILPPEEEVPDITSTKALLKRIWEVYGHYSAIQLSNLTHAPGTPWRKIKEQYGGKIPMNKAIPAEMIREYFAKLAKIQ